MSYLFLASFLKPINMQKKKLFLHRWQRVICVMPGLKLGFDKIATAHHQDDHIETLLLKKSRKASLEGLMEFE